MTTSFQTTLALQGVQALIALLYKLQQLNSSDIAIDGQSQICGDRSFKMKQEASLIVSEICILWYVYTYIYIYIYIYAHSLFQVALRVRPMNHSEFKSGAKITAHAVDSNVSSTVNQNQSQNQIIDLCNIRPRQTLV